LEIIPWTFTDLIINTTYTSPQNDKVKITFTRLPETPGNLLIKEIKLTPEQVAALNAVSDTAYDFTSDMTNGDFEYDLELPLPQTKNNVTVEYTDSVETLGQTTAVTQDKEIKTETISIKGLNHFTLFIIVDDGDTDFSAVGWSSHATGYQGDHKWTAKNQAGKVATWVFTGDAGLYRVSLGWTLWSDHATNASYYLNGNILATVNQKKMADGSLSSNGTFSDWYSTGNHLLQTGDLVTLPVEVGVTDGNLSADAVKFESIPVEFWVDDTYSDGSENNGHVFGYDAFSDIQSAIDAAQVAGEGTIHVLAGAYNESVIIPSGLTDLSIIGVPGAILTGSFTNSSDNSNVSINGFEIKNSSDGLFLTDLQDSTISGNIFRDQESSILNLIGDFTGTEFKFNDLFVTGETSHLLNNLTTAPGFSFNYWGNGLLPTPIIEGDGSDIEINPWLVAPKDTGKITVSGYIYSSDDGNLTLTGKGTTDGTDPGILYAGRYFTPPFGGLSGENLTAVGYYYNVLVEEGSIDWPLHIEIKYDPNNLPAGVIESELKGIYFYNGTSWELYPDSGVNTSEHYFYADVNHLTPIVAGAVHDYTPPSVPSGLHIEQNGENLGCGAYTKNRTITVNWNDSTESDFDHYIYQNKAGTYTNSGLTESSFTGDIRDLDGLYGYKVKSVDTAGNQSEWTSVCEITLDRQPPSTPTLLSPTDDAIVKGNPAQTWRASTGASRYVYESYSDPEATHFVYRNDNITGTSRTVGGTQTIVFWWRVKAVDAAGNESGWSEIRKLTVDNTFPVVTIDPFNTGPTNQDITVTAHTNEGTLNAISHIFSSNGSFNFIANDTAGNQTTKTVTITNIDKENPSTPAGLKRETAGGSTEYQCGVFAQRQTLIPVWDDMSSDPTFDHYEYVSFKPDGNIGTTQTLYVNRFTHSWTPTTDGTNGFSVRSVDKAGNVSGWAPTAKSLAGSCQITYDSTSPSTSAVTQPTNGSVTSNKTFKWSASSDSGSGLRGSDTYRYEISSTADFSSIVRSGEKVSPNATQSTLPEGHYYIRVRAFDAVNNASTWSTTVGFIIDTTAPVLDEKTEYSGWYSSSKTSEFRYTDINGIASGGEVSCLINTEGTNQTCTITPNVCDTAGNCNTIEVISNPANIDLTLPDSRITVPQNEETGSVIFINNWDGVVAGTSSDNLSGVSDVKISIKNTLNHYWNGEDWQDGEEYLLQANTVVESWDNWQYTLDPLPSEGNYTITSHATDNALNFESSYKIILVYDKTIPEVNISVNPVNPDSGNGWYKTRPEVTLTATDINFEKIQYQWDGEVVGKWLDYSGTFKPDTEGAHAIYYRAVDKANNYSDTGIKNIRWDQTDVSKGPQNLNINPNPTSGTESVVKWEAGEDSVGLDKYEIHWKLIGGSSSYTAGVSTSTFKYTIDRLTEGSWEVVVDAVDGAGNRRGVSQTLVVDRTAPATPILELTGTGTGTATLNWNKIDDASDYIIWYGTHPGERQFGTRTGDASSFTVRGLGAGSYYFVIKSVDAAQNQSEESNEVSTGSISGAPGVTPGQPAEGFTPQVQGANADISPSPSITEEVVSPSVLGESDDNASIDWRWLLLLLPLPLILFLYGKRQ